MGSPETPFLQIPAYTPPPGITSNFVNPETRASQLIVASAICMALTTLFVVMRFYTKIFLKNCVSWDDYTCLLAMGGAISFSAVSVSMLKEGVGPHQWNVPVSDFTTSLLSKFVVVDILYSPSILMAKLSLLLMYLQVFRPYRTLTYLIYFGIVFVSLFYTAITIAFAVLNIPKHGQSLLVSVLSSDTAKSIPLGVSQGAVNVATDFYILCIPIPGVWQLQCPIRRKIGICAIFMTGLLACISSVVGLYYRTKLHRFSDVTWDLVPVLLWVVVELNVGVICGCMPSFASFARHHLPSLASLWSRLSSKVKRSHFSQLLGETSENSGGQRLATKDVKVTLGSRVDGTGHLLNLSSVFAPEDEEADTRPGIARIPRALIEERDGTQQGCHREMSDLQRQTALHLQMIHNPTQIHVRSSYLPDVERGHLVHGIHVETQLESSWMHATTPT